MTLTKYLLLSNGLNRSYTIHIPEDYNLKKYCAILEEKLKENEVKVNAEKVKDI